MILSGKRGAGLGEKEGIHQFRWMNQSSDIRQEDCRIINQEESK